MEQILKRVVLLNKLFWLEGTYLLYWASPLFNTNNDKELWKRAAEANKEVIDFVAKME